MAEGNPHHEHASDRAAGATEKLRALRERASQTLDDHRRRIEQVESEINQRVEQLAAEYESSASNTPDPAAAAREGEVADLRRQLADTQQKHEMFIEKLAEARRQLEQLQTAPCVACEDRGAELAEVQAEAARLKSEVEAARTQHQDDQERLDAFVEQLAEARQALDDLAVDHLRQLSQLQSEIDFLQTQRSIAEADLAARSGDATALNVECDALREQVFSLTARAETAEIAQTQLSQQLANAQANVNSLDLNLSDALHQSQSLAEQLSIAEQRIQSLEFAASREVTAQATLQQNLASLQQDFTGLEQNLSTAVADRDAAQQQLAALGTEQGAAQQQLAAKTAEYLAVERKLADSAAEIAELKAGLELVQRQSTADAQQRSELESELDGLRQSLAETERTAISPAELNQIQNARDEARRERDEARASVERSAAQAVELRAALNEARSSIEELIATTAPKQSLDELQKKFDLALADVQKVKRENGALRDELATRRPVDDADSPELASLREERDALAVRVAELESAPPPSDGDVNQQTADLERRFEMAVDDVRQLKKENGVLRDKLAQGSGGVTQGASCGLDWASQKARLLEKLADEDGGGPIDLERRGELLRIEGTIAVTDRVVAEKEEEIGELRATLAKLSGPQAVSPASDSDGGVEEMLSKEEVVAAERQRLATLQQQWEEKLRAAELEFAVERANLARQAAALRDRQVELDVATTAAPGADPDAKPRRRWLDALGLRDEEGKKK